MEHFKVNPTYSVKDIFFFCLSVLHISVSLFSYLFLLKPIVLFKSGIIYLLWTVWEIEERIRN